MLASLEVVHLPPPKPPRLPPPALPMVDLHLADLTAVGLAAAAGKAAAAVAEPLAKIKKDAQKEGLALVPAANTSGFEGVCFAPGVCSLLTKPYKARLTHEGNRVEHLGYYSSAAEGALAYARRLGPQASRLAAEAAAAVLPPPPPPPPKKKQKQTLDGSGSGAGAEGRVSPGPSAPANPPKPAGAKPQASGFQWRDSTSQATPKLTATQRKNQKARLKKKAGAAAAPAADEADAAPQPPPPPPPPREA